MSERENEAEAKAPKRDITAIDRHYYRSLRIRRSISKWMARNIGQLFDDWEDLCTQAANEARPSCSMECAGRWIKTFSAKNGSFELIASEAGLVIALRLSEPK